MQNLNDLIISKYDNYVTFSVKVIPNSSVSKIMEIKDGCLKVKLNSPPIENRANKEIIMLLSKTFGIPKSSIELISGDKNKLKVFKIPITENELIEKIQNILK